MCSHQDHRLQLEDGLASQLATHHSLGQDVLMRTRGSWGQLGEDFEKCHCYFGRGFIESVDGFGEHCHLNNIKYSKQ